MDDEVTLAERKRRKKWSLNPRGRFWTDDENKLGQKMLQKMGWSKGKGLGAQEQGRADPISVNANNDSRGLGFQGNPEQWQSHQEDFENILASLNASSTSVDQPKAKKPKSLEERSKSTKRRVHYHKFTRGKDLSNWKESDHACIFGKKSKRTDKKKEHQAEDSLEEEQIGSVSNQHGVTVIKGGSMADYFSKKWIFPKPSGSLKTSDNSSDEDNRPSFSQERKLSAELEEERPSFSLGGEEKSVFLQEKESSSGFEDERPSFSLGAEGERPSFMCGSSSQFTPSSETLHSEVKPKSKKKKLRDDICESYESEAFHMNENQEASTSESKRKSKKRKHKEKSKEESDMAPLEVIVKRKKSKKNKHVEEETGDLENFVETNKEEKASESKRKKKKKKKDRSKESWRCSAETSSLISGSMTGVQVY